MKKIKLLLIIAIAFIPLINSNPVYAQKDCPITIKLNGDKICFDVPPILVNGKVLIPLEQMAGALGMDVITNTKTKEITLARENCQINIKLGSEKAKVNGKNVQMNVCPEYLNNCLLIPVDFIADCIKAKLVWDKECNVIFVNEYEPLYPVYRLNNGKVLETAYIDVNGKITIPYMKGVGGEFHDGLATLYTYRYSSEVLDKARLYGYINTKGQMVIPQKYRYANQFSEGLAVVSKGLYGSSAMIINKKGERIPTKVKMFTNQFYYQRFMEGFVLFFDDNLRIGYLNKKGNVVIKPAYKSANPFAEGLALVCDSIGNWIFIDKKGLPLTSSEYDISSLANCYSEGLTAAKKDDKWGYINKNNKVAIQFTFDSAGVFSEGMAYVKKDGKYGYINTEGEIAIEPEYEYADDFSEGRARFFQDVGKNGSIAGYLDATGKIALEPVYTYAFPFRNGIAKAGVVIGGKKQDCYINKAGEIIFKADPYPSHENDYLN